MALTDHPAGDYRFLPGIAPYSCGVVCKPGFEIVHVTFQRPLKLSDGFEKVAQFLQNAGRPRTTLCAMSLRSPQPFSFEGFAEFNARYAEVLKSWGVFVNGVNPIARTNVAPVGLHTSPGASAVFDHDSPVLYGFAFSRPCADGHRPTFVVAGAGELPEGILSRDQIVARGNTSDGGLTMKTRFVLDLMEARMFGLGVDWPLVNKVNVYTVHPLTPLLPILLARIGSAGVHGISWHHSRPPIEEIEFEMDLRGTQCELICD